MPRNMSFMLTTKQIKNRTKTVTRRLGWWFLKPGDILNAVEKGMGLKRGEKVNKLCQIRIISCKKILLHHISYSDCFREGFPDMHPSEFIRMFRKEMKCGLATDINRIEFEYV